MEDYPSQITSSGVLEAVVVEDWVGSIQPERQRNFENSASDIPLAVANVEQANPQLPLRSNLFSRIERNLCRRIWFWFLVFKLLGLLTSVWLFLIGVPILTIFFSILLPVTLLGVAFILAFVLTTTVARSTRTSRRQSNRSLSTGLRSFRSGTSRRHLFPLYESSFILSSENTASRVIDWSELGLNSRSLRRFLEGVSEGTIQSLPTYIFSSAKDRKTYSSVENPKEDCLDEAIQVEPVQSTTTEGKEPLKDELSKENLNCAICLEPFRDGECLRILPCFHQFHMDCIDPWLKRKGTCAVCKSCIQEIFWNPM